MTAAEMVFRALHSDDEDVLRRFAVIAAFEPGERRPTWNERHPRVEELAAGWGRPGDVGVLAITPSGRAAGAAWTRFREPVLARSEDGHALPELAIGVEADLRGMGIGSTLLSLLACAARGAGVAEVALYVPEGNPALALYERCAFERREPHEGGWIMTTKLTKEGEHL